ncbi:hypothetical protein [uncultured Mailhella sp.]|uniref:hypothetical protein n=1 Tax=uncultured Mailhella sp. TaxID=1981031 RepID=UPI0032092697
MKLKDIYLHNKKKSKKKSFLPLFNCESGLIYGSSPGTQFSCGNAISAFILSFFRRMPGALKRHQ